MYYEASSHNCLRSLAGGNIASSVQPPKSFLRKTCALSEGGAELLLWTSTLWSTLVTDTHRLWRYVSAFCSQSVLMTRKWEVVIFVGCRLVFVIRELVFCEVWTGIYFVFEVQVLRAVPLLRRLVGDLPSQRPGSIPGHSLWDLWWTKWPWGRFFCRLLPFSPAGIIPRMLQSHLYLRSALIRRTNGRSLDGEVLTLFSGFDGLSTARYSLIQICLSARTWEVLGTNLDHS
jgi:hypothetical protein